VEVVYADRWEGLTRLLGVDVRTGRAVLWRTGPAPEARSVFDTIDLARGVRVDRFAPASGLPALGWDEAPAFATELVAVAQLVAATGPWITRNPSTRPVVVAPSGEPVIYTARPDDGQDGDWLLSASATGRPLGRLDPGLRASYAPAFSPDGTRVVWRGYAARDRGYALWLADTGGRPRRLAVAGGGQPVWSPDGRYVYAVSREATGSEPDPRGGSRPTYRQCAIRVQIADEEVDSLRCVESYHDAYLAVSPSGGLGAWVSQRGESGAHAFRYELLAFPEGRELGASQIERAREPGVLADDGVLVTRAAAGLVAVDLRRDRTALLAAGGGARMFRIDGARELRDGRLPVLRGERDAWEIVIVDPRAALDRRPDEPVARRGARSRRRAQPSLASSEGR
jgi:hypothetical protein